MNLENMLKSKFGYSHFRPGQKDIIQAVLRGRHVLGVLATGSGKTLCYQLASILLPGLTIVVSPLISLMEDQWTRFRQQGMKEIALFHSGLNSSRMEYEWKRIQDGKTKLILLSPERLSNPSFLKRLENYPISLLVVDEAHCVSQWGYDFRPDYLKIKEVYSTLNFPRIMALTGTASPAMQNDILQGLDIMDAEKVVLSMNRPNIAYHKVGMENELEKELSLKEIISKLAGPGIIYAGTRTQTEYLSAMLSNELNMDIPAYHGGLSNENRSIIQTQFIRGETPILVATTAFGMGIDKENIRYVIHFHTPTNIENYLQETGRIGRDGRPGIAIMLFSNQDIHLSKSIIDHSLPKEQQIHEMFQWLKGKKGKISNVLELEHNNPFRLFMHRLQNGGWIETSKEKEGIYYEWKKPFSIEDIQHISEEWNALRMEKYKDLMALSSIFQSKTCIRKNIHSYYNEKDHSFHPFCCSICGIDEAFYFANNKENVETSLWDWEEELKKLLPIGRLGE